MILSIVERAQTSCIIILEIKQTACVWSHAASAVVTHSWHGLAAEDSGQAGEEGAGAPAGGAAEGERGRVDACMVEGARLATMVGK